MVKILVAIGKAEVRCRGQDLAEITVVNTLAAVCLFSDLFEL